MTEASLNSPDGRMVVAEVRIGNDTIIGQVTPEKSVTVPGWIFGHSDLSDRAVRLWGFMKGALVGSFAIPGTSHRSLALLLDVSPRTAREAVYELRDAGALTIVPTFENGRQIRNTYYLWPATPAGTESEGVATDCHGGDTLPAVYNSITNNTIKDTTQNSDKPRRPRRVDKYDKDFESVWKVYPRRVNKNGAYKAFRATLRRGVPVEQLVEATIAYASSRVGAEEQFTMHCATFFGPGERWRDYMPGAALGDDIGPDGVELTAAVIYDLYDQEGSWVDYQEGEPISRVDNPLKYGDRKSTRLNSSHVSESRMPSSA